MVLRRCMVLSVLAAALCSCSLSLAARETLRVLAWPGYADADMVATFEQRQDVDVQVTLTSSDDELWEQMTANRGMDFDVFAVNTAELTRYIEQGLSAPLDMALLPNTARQLPRFRDLTAIPGITRNGQVYAIPFTYSEMGLIYNRKLVPSPPDSMAALWDPQYRGRVLIYDGSTQNFSLTALLMAGVDPFRLTDEQFRQAAQRLVALRRNALTFYSLPEEAVSLFADNEVALVFANYGRQQIKRLQDAGADIGYVIPQEGALAWLDCWVMTGHARNPALVHAWINFMLESEVGTALSERQGLGNTTHASASTQAGDKIIWLAPVEDFERRAMLWNAIRSGDVPGGR